MEQKICMDLEICNLDYTVGHFITVTISWQSWEQHRNMTRMFSKFLTLIILISASNITYLLVSLFILYIGIILYIDGDYLYNKVKDFAISRCKYTCHNSLLHFSPHLKFNGPYKTILAKLPFPQLIAHNPCWSIHQTFKGRPKLDFPPADYLMNLWRMIIYNSQFPTSVGTWCAGSTPRPGSTTWRTHSPRPGTPWGNNIIIIVKINFKIIFTKQGQFRGESSGCCPPRLGGQTSSQEKAATAASQAVQVHSRESLYGGGDFCCVFIRFCIFSCITTFYSIQRFWKVHTLLLTYFQ